MTATTLVLGGGTAAQRVAEALVRWRRPVVMACSSAAAQAARGLEGPLCRIYPGMELIGITGAAGDFNATLAGFGRHATVAAGWVVLAEDEARQARFSDYGLTEGRGVCSLGRLEAALAGEHFSGSLASGPVVAFLHGLIGESHPVVARAVMTAAEELGRRGLRVFVLTGNLKVAGQGLERCYWRCREAGVAFVKFAAGRPRIDAVEGRSRIAFDDEVTGQPCRIDPDLTVVDEAVRPSPAACRAAAVLGLETDPDGFAQADNVRRLPVATNRTGVWVVGPIRGLQGLEDPCADAAAVLQVIVAGGPPPAPALAEIRRAGCARCLTCVRSCPHRAIRLEARPEVMPAACQGCGICAAGCPAMTIAFQDADGVDLEAVIGDALRRREADTRRPLVVALCCRRSAAAAARGAAAMGAAAQVRLRVVEVPCGGSIAGNHLLSLLEHGADGILVLTCHPGNCQAGPGPQLAKSRTDGLAEVFGRQGEGDRLRHATLAANMTEAFADLVNRFAEQLPRSSP